MVVFIEKCSLLVDRLGRTSECIFEVEQKGGCPGPLLPPPPPLATTLIRSIVQDLCPQICAIR